MHVRSIRLLSVTAAVLLFAAGPVIPTLHAQSDGATSIVVDAAQRVDVSSDPRPADALQEFDAAPVDVASATSVSRTKTTGCVSINGLPDAACTPGATDPRVTQDTISSTICVSGYTATVRPPVSVTEPIKRLQMVAYGLQGQPLSTKELDHLIPLELGGSSDVANLWPEPRTGATNAREKDRVENFLHGQVCSGALALADAQQAIVGDWYAVYLTLADTTSNSAAPDPGTVSEPQQQPGSPPSFVPTNAPAVVATAVPVAAAEPSQSTAASSPCLVGQIKANRNSGIYHVPGGASYARTSANVACYATEAEAQAAGFRRALR